MESLSILEKSQILYGKDLAREILADVSREVKELRKHNILPFLMTIQVEGDRASRVYLEAQKRIAYKVGINYESIELSRTTSTARLLGIIDRINRDKFINGLIINLPLPAHLDIRQIQWSINRTKDVEGVTPHNIGRMFLGGRGLKPCTAQAIIALIKSTGIDIKGKEVTVVGHSAIVGKPTAILLLNEEATVSICHYATSERGMLEEHVKNAEILVVAAGKPDLIKGEWIKPGAIVIDAGINNVEGRIVGDVEFDTACKRAAYITPVPGGVGLVTTAYLMKNTIKALHLQIQERQHTKR